MRPPPEVHVVDPPHSAYPQRPLVPTLLYDAGQYGTLAAVRCLGRAGVPVTVAGPRRFVPAAQSRFATRWLAAPAGDDPERLLEWLLAFGKAEPGYYLPPSSDDLAWLLAERRDALSQYFVLERHTPAVIRRLLDKRELIDTCAAAGIAVPCTYFPRDRGDVERIAREQRGPVVLKPRTQVLHRFQGKGRYIASPADLPVGYDAYMATNHFHPWIVAWTPDIGQPMVQEFHASAAGGIYSVAGFASVDGTVTSLASRKILQRPRRLGIGLCFESAELKPQIDAALARLCRLLGYVGIFEAEFVEIGDELLLIDFNPRYYSQMQFEIDRGLLLPLLAYQLAVMAPTLPPSPARDEAPRGYVHEYLFALLLRGWQLTGQMSAEESNRWRAWRRKFSPGAVSFAARDEDDTRPMLIDRINITMHLLKHPRANARWLLFER